jgi:hypothetical protein
MKIGAAFPSKYLRAADLDGEVTVRIRDIKMEDIAGDGVPKPVLFFGGSDKGLVLNKTNANAIIDLVGTDETDQWKGKRIALYATKVDFQGKRVDAIRVCEPEPVAAPVKRAPVAPPPDEGEDDPTPF